jgi:homoserine acetyltransferase
MITYRSYESYDSKFSRNFFFVDDEKIEKKFEKAEINVSDEKNKKKVWQVQSYLDHQVFFFFLLQSYLCTAL